MASPSMGWTLLYQLVIKKTPHRYTQANLMGAVPQLSVPLPSSEVEKRMKDREGKLGRGEIGREKRGRKQKPH